MTFKPGLTLTDARKHAKAKLGEVAKGGDPLTERRRQEGEAVNTLKAVTEEFMKREAGRKREADGKATLGGKLRSARTRLQVFERLVYPAAGSTGKRQITVVQGFF